MKKILFDKCSSVAVWNGKQFDLEMIFEKMPQAICIKNNANEVFLVVGINRIKKIFEFGLDREILEIHSDSIIGVTMCDFIRHSPGLSFDWNGQVANILPFPKLVKRLIVCTVSDYFWTPF